MPWDHKVIDKMTDANPYQNWPLNENGLSQTPRIQ